MRKSSENIVYTSSLGLFDEIKASQQIHSTNWGASRTITKIRKSFEKSIVCFAISDKEQVGFIRIISDECFFAYVAEVYVDELHRGKGVGTSLFRFSISLPMLKEVSNWMVTTQSSQEFFRKIGFKPANSEKNLAAKRSDLILN